MRVFFSLTILLLTITNLTAQWSPNFSVNGKGINDITNVSLECMSTDPTTCPTYDVSGMNWYLTGVTGDPFHFQFSSVIPPQHNYAKVVNGQFWTQDPDGDICITSPVLNIASLGTITASYSVFRSGNCDFANYSSPGDTVYSSYRIDGGAWVNSIQPTDVCGSTSSWTQTFSGNTAEVRLCMDANSVDEDYAVTNMSVDLGTPVAQCPTFSGAPANVSITNSSCQAGCIVSGGVITAPGGTPCPTGSSIRYQVGAGPWSATLPIYAQNGPSQSIKTRCTCDSDATLNSAESSPIATNPGSCPSFSSSITAQTNIICNGGNNGSLTVTKSGGSPNFNYVWSNGANTLNTNSTSNTINNLTAGTYTVTVTDVNGCTTTTSGTITQPTLLSLTPASQTNIACNGGATGAASVNPASGGTPGYTYDWSPGTPTGDGTTSISGLTAGTYTCIVTDANNCTASATFTISQPPLLTVNPASQTNVACFGGSTGAASVTVTGGAGVYTYNWSPGNPTGDGTASVTGLIVGTYTCVVTDANSCTASASFTITQPSVLNLTPASQTNIACNGASTGAASVNIATGGAGGYTYDWSPGTPTGDGTTSVSGLTAGTYTCVVTDANNCTASVSFTITQPTPITLTPASQTDIACFGEATGAASVNGASGGTGGFMYDWIPGNPTGDGTTSVSGLTAGTYTCIVTDANSCTASRTFTITQPPLLTLTANNQTNVACFGDANGTASVNVAIGGRSPYTYDWTPGNPTGDGTTSVSGLTAGTYTCIVTDSYLCTASQTFTITQLTQLTVTPSSQTNVACFGAATGAASVNTPTGGAGGYTYDWSPGNPTGDGTTSVSGLTAGTYTCVVMDANSCSASQTFTITQPTAISLTPASQTNIACNGDATGAASVNTPTGGAGGYTYDWSPGTPTGDGTTSISGLTAGTYTCVVTDANLCTASQTFTITQPPMLNLTPASQTNVSCNGVPTGAASVNPATGGTGGYTYDWSPGDPVGNGTTSISWLLAGTYTCVVTDANSCTASVSFTITQPPVLSVSINSQTNVSCNGGDDGSLTATINGGTANYGFLWSNNEQTLNTPSTTNTINNLEAGTYGVTVYDSNSCSTADAATITEPQSISITYMVTSTCSGFDTGSIDINVIGGTPNYTYEWSNGAQTQNITNLGTGTYTVTVVDANLCSSTEVIVIDIPTVYTTIADGEFNDPAIWDGNCIPPNPVPNGTIVNINHPLTNPLSNILMNDGTIIVSSPNQFINHGTFKGKGTVEGNFVNNGFFKPGD